MSTGCLLGRETSSAPSSRQPPCRKPAPFPPPPALSQTRWGRCRLIAHLSSTPELINSGSDFGTLPPVAPTSGWSPEERGGEGLGKARAVGGCALTFALIPVSVSSCRSRHCLASGPRQPAPPCLPGAGGAGGCRVTRWGGHGLAPGMRLQRASGSVTASLRPQRGPSGRRMEGRVINLGGPTVNPRAGSRGGSRSGR